MSIATRINVEPVRSRGFATIAAGFLSVGDPLTNPTNMLVYVNNTDVVLMVSWNGVDDHQPILPGGFVQDVTTNRVSDGGFYIPEHTQFYVRHLDDAPSSGSFYITNYYSDGYQERS